MYKHKYRVYLNGLPFDTVIDCPTASQGQTMLEAQYGCSVTWMGAV